MSDPIGWDAGLIRRYDKAGRPYTSYPSAGQLHDGILPTDLFAAIRESGSKNHPLSLYIHLPFCANGCYYCACTRVITKDRSRAQLYLQALQREIELFGTHVGKGQRVEQLHVGGGTPAFLGHDDLRSLMDKLRCHFNLQIDDTADHSVDVDPREADWSTMGLLREIGFNRVTFGVQDFDPQVQRAINRLQSIEQTQAVMDAARTLAYRSVNIDLVYGLPKQTPDSFARTVEIVIGMSPDRLRLYHYTHRPDLFAPQRHIEEADLPCVETRRDIFGQSVTQLLAAGYRHIGMEQFALPDDSLSNAQDAGKLYRNFQGYTANGGSDLIGLGVSALSQVGDLHCRNPYDMKLYQQSLGEGRLAIRHGLKCTADDRLRRVIINQLMCRFSLRFADIEERFNIDFQAYFADCQTTLRQMHEDGLIQIKAEGLDVLPAGRLLISAVCRVFDAYQHLPENLRYAQII